MTHSPIRHLFASSRDLEGLAWDPVRVEVGTTKRETAAFVASVIVITAAPALAQEPLVLAPTADSFVREDDPSQNFGSAPWLRAGDYYDDTQFYSYLAFAAAADASTTGTLRVCIELGFPWAGEPVRVHTVSDDAWTEGGLTYANRPAIGPVVASFPNTEEGCVTASVPIAPGQTNTYALSRVGEVNRITSDESSVGADRPTLTVVAGDVFSRTVSLRLDRHLVASGVVVTTPDQPACVADTTVRVERRAPTGSWRTVNRTRTAADGAYRVRIPDVTGTYRARVGRGLLETGEVCTADRSRPKAHRHR
jgi:hypothetical protein